MCVGIFLKLLRSPTVASEPGLWEIQVILLTNMSYFGLAVLLDEAARTDITRTLTRDWFYRRALHTGGWRVSVSPTLVEPSVATPGPYKG